MCFPTRHMKYSMYNNHFFAINDVTNISRLKSTASQRSHTQTLLFLNMHTFSTFNRNMGENIYIASPPAEERSIELSDSTLPHCRNNLEMKNMSIRGTQWSHAIFFSPQWKAEVVFFLFILSTFTSAPVFFLQHCLCLGTAEIRLQVREVFLQVSLGGKQWSLINGSLAMRLIFVMTLCITGSF